MKHLRKRIRIVAFSFFCLFFSVTALQNKALAGANLSSQKSINSSQNLASYDICGPGGLAAFSGAVAAGVTIVAGMYGAGTAVGEFARNLVGAELQLSQIEQQYVSDDFSKFDI